jgi:putative ABC transport system ATP-binding protein
MISTRVRRVAGAGEACTPLNSAVSVPRTAVSLTDAWRWEVSPRPPHASRVQATAKHRHADPTTVSDMLAAIGLTKEFTTGPQRLTVLRDVSFELPDGAFVAIVGPSGSGKTTLLGLLAGLDTPTHGEVYLDGAPLHTLSEDARARLRAEKVGFVFQNFQLIPTLTAVENVGVPLELRGERGAMSRASEVLRRVGLEERLQHYPAQLSGGEQQRVAIARAFANRPSVLFADEPTGNLDGATGERIIELLKELNESEHTSIILVTHDRALAERAQRTIRLRDGQVVEDRGTPVAASPLLTTSSQDA